MDNVCMEAKENLKKGLAKLNKEPINDENAELYHLITESLYHLELVEAMKNEYGYSGVYYDDGMMRMPHNSYEGRNGMPSNSYEGRMNQSNEGGYSEGRHSMPRYYYSGHMGKEHMMTDLKAMLADADTEKERRMIRDLIEDLQQLK